jgi:hypothetical protein
MEIQLTALVIYSVTAIYLLWKVVHCAFKIWQTRKYWGFRHMPNNRLANVDQPDKQVHISTYYLSVIGFLAGIVMALIYARKFQTTYLSLLFLATIGIILEVFRPSHAQHNLPDVISLIGICRAATDRELGLIDAFRFASHRLPPGQVKTAVEEVINLQRKGLPLAQCLVPLTKCNHYLDYLAAFYEAGGSAHTGTYQLTAILHRARWEWARDNQTYLMRSKAQKYLYPLRSIALGGLTMTFMLRLPDFHRSLVLIWTNLFV